NFILMNYSYYIISKKPSKLLVLKKNIDDEVFSNILSTIVYRGVFVDRRKISQLGIDDYINLPERSSHKLFNLIYAV
ncbi:hypothetical protein SNN82_004141, partial [Cronobacter sakazakii]|nr:hypothetical protein [Cronobacter sakazakii]